MKVEGRNAVSELLKSDTRVDRLLVKEDGDKTLSQIIQMARKKGVSVRFLKNDALDRESTTQHHQGVIAICDEYKYYTVKDIIETAKERNEAPFIVILDGIEDPHNFGSIIRVCECMGVHGIIFGKNRACGITETVLKTSAGAANHVKIAKVTNINQEIEELKKQGVWVYACELGGEDLSKSRLDGSIAIVIGSEGNGVSVLTKKLCDGIVTIPMKGQVNSLNASVATGIILWEVAKNR